MGKARTDFRSNVEDLAPAIVDIVGSLDPDQLEKLTIESILEHRRLLDVAEAAYDALMAAQEGSEQMEELRLAYTRAMVENKAKMAVVAALVQHLGHIPDVPENAA